MATYAETHTEPRTTDAAETHHTTIIRETAPSSSSSGAGWLIAIVLIIGVAIGAFVLTQTSASETMKDNAIAEAANDVGNAATQIGDAAQDAANTIKN